MEYYQFEPQITQLGQLSQESQPNSTPSSSRRSGSVELRAGKLYPTCDCIKRNGLQHECRRTECQGKSCCMTQSGPTCNPSSFAKRLANHSMGSSSESRSRDKVRENRNHKMPEASNGKGNELAQSGPFGTGTEDFAEIKDIDPKTLGQMFPNGIPTSVPYGQFNAAPMMNPPMQAFPPNFNGFPVGQTTMMNAPQMTSGAQAQNQAKGLDTTQAMMNAQPQNFGAGTAQIPSMESSMMPTIQALPGNTSNAYPPGVSVVQNGQPFGIPAQSFAPYTGGMGQFSPYGSNFASYLPCGPGMPSMETAH